MSDGVGAARHRKLWCRKWSSLLVRRSSYTTCHETCAPEHTLCQIRPQSFRRRARGHHRTSSRPPSDIIAATIGSHLIYNPRENVFFFQNHPAKILHRVLCLEILRLRVEFLLKTDSGYPKDTGVASFTLVTPGNPLHYNTHRSAPPVSTLSHSRGPGARQADGL